jgi:membrane-anchored glycerophosphoryl diester phosphodiesterase (GDPDase)
MLVAFVVAAYFGVRYGVAVPAAVLENLGPNSALRRSVELTEDYRGRIFLIWLCAIVLAYATATLLQLPFMVGAFLAGPGTATALVLNVIGLVLGTAGSTFTGPIMIIGLALAYYDLRIRKEALDLQMMFESIDAPRA